MSLDMYDIETLKFKKNLFPSNKLYSESMVIIEDICFVSKHENIIIFDLN